MKHMKTKKNNKLDLKVIITILIIIIFVLLIYYLLENNNSVEYKIILNGDRYIILNQGDKYIEPGFSAYLNNQPVTDKVVVTNEILESVPGIYRVIYEIENYSEYRYVEIKKVFEAEVEKEKIIDYKLEIDLEVDNTNITNKDIEVNVKVSGDTFSSLTLPDGSVIKSNETNFIIKENGKYKFIAKNINDEITTKEIVIDNIDKVSPSGSCTATLLNSSTTISVKSAESNLTYHYYDNNRLITSISKNNYVINSKTSEIIKVILEDRANNKNEIKCAITDKRYYEPVVPNSNEKIVYHANTDTLKAYIVDKSSYYMTYIWVKDAYTQLNKSASPEYGEKLYYPRELVNKANTKNNLYGKVMIAFNASGFYLKGSYDAASVDAYSAYNKTSVGTIVINNGVLVRNAYKYAVKTWYTIGVNKDNKLLVFEDLKTNNVSEKQAWAQRVISSGIRNTFTFAAPLIQNGKRTNITTSMPGGFDDVKGLQLICQINENNFLLFTSRDETRNKAITEFLRLGCQTAMNLDGGGSIALLYKDKNSNEIIRIIGGNRDLPEVGYFSE